MEPAVIEWLMAGDPVIRWQVMRDLLDRPRDEWEAERNKVATEGWGAAFLAHQLPDGRWPEGRWTGATWTLLLIVDCGLLADWPTMRQAIEAPIQRLMPSGQPVDRKVLLEQMDLCHLGFWLRFGAYFAPDDPRWPGLAETILSTQLADGGWNCRIRMKPKTHHGSFHTTFNILEGLREAANAGIVDRDRFRAAEERALEFMLAHRMYRSDRTGEVVSERFTHLSYPSHWHYTVLRGLDYMRLAPEIKDRRLVDPLDMIEGRKKANGRWPVEKRIPGDTLFDMESMGGDSRWNTLKALRALRAAGR